MNRRPLNSLPLQKAITGFVNYKTAERLSDRSVDSYKRILEHWAKFAGTKHFAQFARGVVSQRRYPSEHVLQEDV